MFICLGCDPNHELGDGYTPAFCSEHSPEPASSDPRRPHLAVEFVREHMRGAIPAGRRPGPAVRPAPASRPLSLPVRRRQSRWKPDDHTTKSCGAGNMARGLSRTIAKSG